ncbi:MAG TPA: FHA domain-containing protein [Candidatus Angelobacter sp.]|nr:FHA domain-containing protein [Candidatus Angelobacter sp.]
MTGTPAVTAAFRIIQGPLRGQKFRFETNLITIGRNEDANISLADDRSVSRLHAEVHLVDGHYVLRNRSNSGTFVNDKLLLDEKRLASKDRIRIGDHHVLEFTEVSTSAAASPKGSRTNKLVIGGAVYMVLLAGLAVFLSRPSSAGKSAADAQEIQQVMDHYTQFAGAQHLSKEEQDARVRAASAFLRAGLIAQRQGQYDQARQIYLRLLEFAPEVDSPVHKYAVVQLRSVPVTR